MKQTADLDRFQRNMRPGSITLEGMLGRDRRHLIDILDDDAAAVRRLRTTHQAIAARMQELRDAGAKGLGLTIRVLDRFDVRIDNVRGKLPCPFEDGVLQKTFIEVENRATGKSVRFTDLHIHMIREHGFYEGHGATFRIDPATLVEVLEIEPEPDS
jgi:hypothetical protein